MNPSHPIVSVLTASGEDDSKMALYKLCLDGGQAAADAKYLLGSLYDSSLGDTLPTTFANRQPFQAILGCVVRNKRMRKEFDHADSDSTNQDSEPSPSGGVGRHPTSGTDVRSSSRSGGTAHQINQGVAGGYGGAPMSMASALSLFTPPADRDVANELDLLDMMDENEQYEIVDPFATKHIFPYMTGGSL